VPEFESLRGPLLFRVLSAGLSFWGTKLKRLISIELLRFEAPAAWPGKLRACRHAGWTADHQEGEGVLKFLSQNPLRRVGNSIILSVFPRDPETGAGNRGRASQWRK
jgi:hypothetical protein